MLDQMLTRSKIIVNIQTQHFLFKSITIQAPQFDYNFAHLTYVMEQLIHPATISRSAIVSLEIKLFDRDLNRMTHPTE